MINMEPPPAGKKLAVQQEYALLTRDTGRRFILDKEDWLIVKEIPWFEINGSICAENGVKLEKYLGFKGRKHKFTEKNDFRRQNYGRNSSSSK